MKGLFEFFISVLEKFVLIIEDVIGGDGIVVVGDVNGVVEMFDLVFRF